MPEDFNTEIAADLAAEDGLPSTARTRSDLIVEIAEAILLGIVAIATAWSGYQAARWDGRQAELYGRASTTRIEADESLTLGGQQRLLDVSTFNTWIEVTSEGRDELAALYERRFSPEFKVAFDAWIALDPLSNPDAPPGPSFMPEYVNPLLEQGVELNERADQRIRDGHGRPPSRGRVHPHHRGARVDPVPARALPAIPHPPGEARRPGAGDLPDALRPGHDRDVPSALTPPESGPSFAVRTGWEAE